MCTGHLNAAIVATNMSETLAQDVTVTYAKADQIVPLGHWVLMGGVHLSSFRR